MPGGRIFAAGNGLHVAVGGIGNDFGNVREFIDKPGRAGAEAEHIVQDDHVAVSTGAGPAAYDRTGDGFDNLGRHFVRYRFEQKHGGAGFGQQDRVINNTLGVGSGSPLREIPTLLHGPLGQQAEVGTYRNTGSGHGLDDFPVAGVDFKFYAIGAGLANETSGIGDAGDDVGIAGEG